jgi:hypothetical protein
VSREDPGCEFFAVDDVEEPFPMATAPIMSAYSLRENFHELQESNLTE